MSSRPNHKPYRQRVLLWLTAFFLVSGLEALAALDLRLPADGSKLGNAGLEKTIATRVRSGDIDRLADRIHDKLLDTLQTEDGAPPAVQELLNTPGWRHALILHRFFQIVPLSQIEENLANSETAIHFWVWLLTHPQMPQTFVDQVSEHDDLTRVFSIWETIFSKETAEQRETYRNLALATALVHDRPIHAMNASEEETIDPLARYQLFRSNAERKRLKTRLHDMSVSDLVWVVDVALDDTEIEWALTRVSYNRRKWGKAYSDIDYLMERAVLGEDPYEVYSLSEIERHGGICGDQTYFSKNTAKANGVPATGIIGTGARGAHAWLAYKPDSDEWDTSTGRYEDYSNGSTRHPQTHQPFAEFDLLISSDRKMRPEAIERAEMMIATAQLMEKNNLSTAVRSQLIEQAIATAPLHAPNWLAYITYLESNQEPSTTQAQWQDVVDDIERTFKAHPTMWLTARDITLKHLLKDADKETLEKNHSRFRKELARRFPARTDLIRQVFEEQVKSLPENTSYDDLRKFFRDTLSDFGEDSENFKLISRTYFDKTKKLGNQSKEVVDDIHKSFSRHIDQESSDFFRAGVEIGILRDIASFYGQAGEARMREKLEKEADKREANSSKI